MSSLKKSFHTPVDKNKKERFIPLCIINDKLAEKNGTKKTVFWVKKKPREETGDVKGEKWVTSQQYIGDWKKNKKDGYGVKIYSNKDKYEGYWKNDMRHGKGTYWLCIGKNTYRKLYTGDWCENKKEGKGIFFYKDGGCYDGNWKNSKRDGKGLMIYSNGDTYEGHWQNDLKHGYGIIEYEYPENKKGHKYYGYWCKDLKEGQGYYYFSDTGKIYLGEWHEDIPRTGIYTTVEEAKLTQTHDNLNNIGKVPEIRVLRLKDPMKILEESISNVHFIRQIKLTKKKNFSELFAFDYQQELINLFKYRNTTTIVSDNDANKVSTERTGSKLPESYISIVDFKTLIKAKLNITLDDEVLEIIFFIFDLISDKKPLTDSFMMDFLIFSRTFYLIFIKYIQAPPVIDYSAHSVEDGINNKTDSLKLNNNISEPRESISDKNQILKTESNQFTVNDFHNYDDRNKIEENNQDMEENEENNEEENEYIEEEYEDDDYRESESMEEEIEENEN